MAAREGPGPDLVRRVLDWTVGVAAGLALVASTIWWWNVGGPVPIVQALYPAVALGSLAVAVVAAAMRARPAFVTAVAAVAVAAVAVVPTLLPASPARVEAAADDLGPGRTPGLGQSPGRSETAPGGGSRVAVFALNTQFGLADIERIREVVAARRIDVLVLTEAGPQFTPYVTDSLGDLLPHSSGATIGGAGGTLIMSRYPMTVLDRDDADDTKHQQPTVRLDVNGAPVVVRGVHPRSPTSQRKLAAWHADLVSLADWQRGAGGPLIIAGDFNAGWPHPVFRAIADGMDDAMRVTGQAWKPTWPADARTPPFTQIDHVLVRGFAVDAAGTEYVPGSDHLGVWSDLTLR